MSSPTTEPKKERGEADPFRHGWRWAKQDDGSYQQLPLTSEDLLHPPEDGEVFIVTNLGHDRDCRYLAGALEQVILGREGFEVVHDMRVDWKVSDVRPHCPDLAVFSGVQWAPERDTGTFRVKTNRATPVIVIEVTSEKTRSNDLFVKVEHYFKAGVPIYAIVDYRPELEERRLHVLGYRATPEGYVRMPMDDRGRLWIEPLKIWLGVEGDHAVCHDEQNNCIPDVRMKQANRQNEARIEELQTISEEAITARQEAERNATEAERRRKDEARLREGAEARATDLAARLADLEAELRRLRGENP